MDLSHCDLYEADFTDASLDEADLEGAQLFRAELRNVYGIAASFKKANCAEAKFNGSYFGLADFRDAQLVQSVFLHVVLAGADFGGASVGNTAFVGCDLSHTIGLDQTQHRGPSSVAVDTLGRSRGRIPESFLRGCGLSDTEIEFAKLYREGLTSEEVTNITYRIDELRGTRPIQLSPVFISYSHDDAVFVDELEKRLNANSIRFWRDTHDLKAGRLETQIDRAIRMNPVVILVLSQHSVESDWVEFEAGKARELEKELKRDVLCPVALDDSWRSCPWPGPLRKQIEKYNVLDFSKNIETQFAKLKEGLGLFYAK